MIECLEKNLLEFRALTWSAGVYSLLGTPPKGKEEAVKSSEAQRGSQPLVSERATALMDLRAGRAPCSTSCLPPAPRPPGWNAPPSDICTTYFLYILFMCHFSNNVCTYSSSSDCRLPSHPQLLTLGTGFSSMALFLKTVFY